MTKTCQIPACLLFLFCSLFCLANMFSHIPISGWTISTKRLQAYPFHMFYDSIAQKPVFCLGKSIHKICINFFILKSIAFINQILMFPALINLTSTKPVLQNLPCLSWPNLSNKKGQKLSSKFLNTTTSNLYIKVLALCIFYTCFFIAHAKYNMNLNIN